MAIRRSARPPSITSSEGFTSISLDEGEDVEVDLTRVGFEFYAPRRVRFVQQNPLRHHSAPNIEGEASGEMSVDLDRRAESRGDAGRQPLGQDGVVGGIRFVGEDEDEVEIARQQG